jgi:hypothetical protein
MKIGTQQIEKDDIAAYAETMRGLATADKQDPFDAEIDDALDQLGRLHDIIGERINRTKRSKSNVSSSSSSIEKASMMN